jgi:hypothetical protein
MANLAAWLPPLAVGILFTCLGCAKFYGLASGIVGGAQKPFLQRLFGT